MELSAAYAYCKSVIERHSSTFFAAFGELAPSERNAVWAVYAFCRLVDDIVDEGTSSMEQRISELEAFHEQFQSMGSECSGDVHPVFVALEDVFSRYQMQKQPFIDMIVGQRMDLCFHQPATLADLEEYCYHVAGTVGLMLLPILHNRPSATEQRQVVSLGIAMQLTNILRDVSEDARRGRIYIPAASLDAHGVTTDDILVQVYSDKWRQAATEIGRRAEQLYEHGLQVAESFSETSRFAVLASGRLYQAILKQIQASDYQVFGVRHYVDAKERRRILSKLALAGRPNEPVHIVAQGKLTSIESERA